MTTAIRSRLVHTPGGPRAGCVHVADGRIAAITAYDDAPRGALDLGDTALLPGLVDTHVHVNEPGRTEWEGFDTATAAAAAGGVTTIVDMPLNAIPPTTTVEGLRAKRAAARGHVHVDVGFWGGAVPGNVADLAPLHAAGVFGFKCFTSPSGVDEFPHLPWGALPAHLDEVARLGALLIAHAEDPDGLDAAPAAAGARFADFAASRPPSVEDVAVERLACAAHAAGARAHVVHLASASAVPIVAAARAAGAAITAETCPHYLTLDADAVPDGATEFKCCPPIRDRANADGLWRGLADGVIACVVSDHSPCVPELKRGDFAQAWGGIASVQLGLPVVWTAARARGVDLATVVEWMAAAPARLVGLDGRKGAIAVGLDADLVAFDPDAELTVDGAALRHRHPTTPYHGRRLTGVVRRTWLRGEPVDGDPRGDLLARP